MMLTTVVSFVPENISAEIPKPICICLFIKTMYFDCVLIYTWVPFVGRAKQRTNSSSAKTIRNTAIAHKSHVMLIWRYNDEVIIHSIDILNMQLLHDFDVSKIWWVKIISMHTMLVKIPRLYLKCMESTYSMLGTSMLMSKRLWIMMQQILDIWYNVVNITAQKTCMHPLSHKICHTVLL